MRSFSTPEPITAHVELAAGSVRLIASDRADTVVEVRPRDDSRAGDIKAAEQARIDFANGTLWVSAHRHGLSGRFGAVDVSVELPARSVLRGHVASANVYAQGQLGDCRVDSASGEVDLDRTAAVMVHTASGGVRVGSIVGGAKIATASGTVTVRSIEGSATISTASGHTIIGAMAGGLKFASASAAVSVGASTAGPLKLSTASGDIEIGIPEGTAAHLDLRTRSGSVRNRLESADGPADGEESVSVSARTASGDIVIVRSAHAAAAP